MHQTIPILLSKDLEATAQEYEKLGFSIERKHIASGYLIAVLDGIELHFSFWANLVPEQSNCMCYIRTEEVDAIYNLWQFARIQGQGIPRLEKIEDKPWGMREFAFVDGNGNLIRVGKRL